MPNEFKLVLNGIPKSINYAGSCASHDGGCRLHIDAPDDFGVPHTTDFLLKAHRQVVHEDYSELGMIYPSDTFTVSFWMYSIDGKPPSEHVSFSGSWDLLYLPDKGIPPWLNLVLEPNPIRFPQHGESFDIKEASDTPKPLAIVGTISSRMRPMATPFPTKECTPEKPLAVVGSISSRIPPTAGSFQQLQCSSMTLNALLILIVFLAGMATSNCFLRRRRRRREEMKQFVPAVETDFSKSC